MKKSQFKLGLDLLMMLSLLLIMVPKMLGQTIHEWAGLLIAAVFILHLGLNWNRFKTITVNFLHRLPARARITYILNLIIFSGFVCIIISGMFISKTIDFSWLSISPGGGMGWKQLHTATSYLTFLLAGIHMGLNWNQVLRMTTPGHHVVYEGGPNYEY